MSPVSRCTSFVLAVVETKWIRAKIWSIKGILIIKKFRYENKSETRGRPKELLSQKEKFAVW